jgi:hypothetical protein
MIMASTRRLVLSQTDAMAKALIPYELAAAGGGRAVVAAATGRRRIAAIARGRRVVGADAGGIADAARTGAVVAGAARGRTRRRAAAHGIAARTGTGRAAGTQAKGHQAADHYALPSLHDGSPLDDGPIMRPGVPEPNRMRPGGAVGACAQPL